MDGTKGRKDGVVQGEECDGEVLGDKVGHGLLHVLQGRPRPSQWVTSMIGGRKGGKEGGRSR